MGGIGTAADDERRGCDMVEALGGARDEWASRVSEGAKPAGPKQGQWTATAGSSSDAER